MNGVAPGKTSSKKGIKPLPGLPDIASIFSNRDKNSTHGIFPKGPPPPGPNLSALPYPRNVTPPKVRSPADNTQIIINGVLSNLDIGIKDRINENSIRPITPPPRPDEIPEVRQEPLSPFYVPNNVKIIKTPELPIPRQIIPVEEEEQVHVSNVNTPSTCTDSIASRSTRSSRSTVKKGNIFSMLPNLNKIKANNNDHIPETVNAASPVNIPIPVFNFPPRVVSPIQTVGGPKSPSPINKPSFNMEGKSSTPRRTSPRPQTVRAKTPPPAFRTHQNNEPQFQGFGGMKPDYANITNSQEAYLRQEFRMKFGILRANYPQWNVIEPNESLTVQQIHDLYNHYIHEIMVSRETGQYKVYMVVFLMVIEVIGVKFLKLNMSGYTMSQLKIMNRYDTLFTELGEKWLVGGGVSNWPVEARIMMMMMFNAVIFLVVRYLCSWLGVEGLADTLQNWIDGMLNGPTFANSAIPQDYQKPNVQSNPGVPEVNASTNTSNPVDNITNAFSNFFSNNAGNIGEKIAQIGTVFSNKLQNNNKVQEGVKKPTVAQMPQKKLNKKKLFEE